MSTFDSMFLPGGDLGSGELVDFNTDYQHDFTAINDFSGNTGTVSPQDLMRDDSMIMSAPPSTAFPNLSTPESGYLESPAMASSGLNTSPMEDALLDGSLNFSELDAMTPLFPQNSYDQFAQLSGDKFHTSASFSSVNSRPSSAASPMVRQKSSPGRPPTYTHGRKLSSTSGVVKASNATKRTKPLPEIQIDSDDDKETAKRKKNTAAARMSRQRKQEHNESLQAEIARLRAVIYRIGGDPDEQE